MEYTTHCLQCSNVLRASSLLASLSTILRLSKMLLMKSKRRYSVDVRIGRRLVTRLLHCYKASHVIYCTSVVFRCSVCCACTWLSLIFVVYFYSFQCLLLLLLLTVYLVYDSTVNYLQNWVSCLYRRIVCASYTVTQWSRRQSALDVHVETWHKWGVVLRGVLFSSGA